MTFSIHPPSLDLWCPICKTRTFTIQLHSSHLPIRTSWKNYFYLPCLRIWKICEPDSFFFFWRTDFTYLEVLKSAESLEPSRMGTKLSQSSCESDVYKVAFSLPHPMTPIPWLWSADLRHTEHLFTKEGKSGTRQDGGIAQCWRDLTGRHPITPLSPPHVHKYYI